LTEVASLFFGFGCVCGFGFGIKLYPKPTKPKFQTSRHMAEGTIKAVSGAYTVQDKYCFL